jgi:hypothetical protein
LNDLPKNAHGFFSAKLPTWTNAAAERRQDGRKNEEEWWSCSALSPRCCGKAQGSPCRSLRFRCCWGWRSACQRALPAVYGPRWLQRATGTYVVLVQGTPLLIQLFLGLLRPAQY